MSNHTAYQHLFSGNGHEHEQDEPGMAPEFNFLQQLLDYRLGKYFAIDRPAPVPHFPDLASWDLPIRDFIRKHDLSVEEMIILLLALAPHALPDLFDRVIESRLNGSGDFPKIGGIRGKNHRGFLPTGETAIFLLGGEGLPRRLSVQQLFGAGSFFTRHRVLHLEEVPAGEPAMSGRLILSAEHIELFLTGQSSRPHFNASFPARYITTQQDWADLVLNDDVKQQIRELEIWLQYNDILMKTWNMQKRIAKGYRVLFHGPPGTGKTLTASLLGKYTGRDVYRIDLSMVVSKYIGETEKNLENLFAKAESRNWILFFDEADALFGKRTNVRDAHDKYANQEVSYLLQRVEDYDGLVILATNMKNNIDDAFVRRFNAIIKFSMPDEQERVSLWRKSFPGDIYFQDDQDIPELIKKYELAGGSIINVVQYSCLKAIEKKGRTIYLQDVLNGIKREMHKEGKPFFNVL